MADSKEMLEATVKGLQEKCEQLTSDLQAKRRELEDVNKPKISQSVYEEIEDSVFNNINDALDRLEERTNYDVEMELSGNEINIYNIDFHDSNNVSEYILDIIKDSFNIVDTENVDEDPSYDEMKENKVLSEA